MRDQRRVTGELRIVESPFGTFPCMIIGPAFSERTPFLQEALPLFFGLWPESCFATRKKAETELARLQRLEDLSLIGPL